MIFSKLFGKDKDKGGDVANRNRRTATGTGPATAPAPTTGRTRPPDAPIIGHAVPRTTVGASGTTGGAPEMPDAVQLGANNSAEARAAALRARRKGAGSSVLNLIGPGGANTPTPSLTPRTLRPIGS